MNCFVGCFCLVVLLISIQLFSISIIISQASTTTSLALHQPRHNAKKTKTESSSPSFLRICIVFIFCECVPLSDPREESNFIHMVVLVSEKLKIIRKTTYIKIYSRSVQEKIRFFCVCRLLSVHNNSPAVSFFF